MKLMELFPSYISLEAIARERFQQEHSFACMTLARLDSLTEEDQVTLAKNQLEDLYQKELQRFQRPYYQAATFSPTYLLDQITQYLNDHGYQDYRSYSYIVKIMDSQDSHFGRYFHYLDFTSPEGYQQLIGTTMVAGRQAVYWDWDGSIFKRRQQLIQEQKLIPFANMEQSHEFYTIGTKPICLIDDETLHVETSDVLFPFLHELANQQLTNSEEKTALSQHNFLGKR